MYAPDRKATQPIAHLSGFAGVLQVDSGYAGYRASPSATMCSLLSAGPMLAPPLTNSLPPGPAPIAAEALERIAELYAIKKDVRSRDATNAAPSARTGAGRIIDGLEPWLLTSSP